MCCGISSGLCLGYCRCVYIFVRVCWVWFGFLIGSEAFFREHEIVCVELFGFCYLFLSFGFE